VTHRPAVRARRPPAAPAARTAIPGPGDRRRPARTTPPARPRTTPRRRPARTGTAAVRRRPGRPSSPRAGPRPRRAPPPSPGPCVPARCSDPRTSIPSCPHPPSSCPHAATAGQPRAAPRHASVQVHRLLPRSVTVSPNR
jgi:hypothetical protein